MRIVIACRLVFGAVALLPQQAAAQFAEKKVLTLAIARKIVATAETEAARHCRDEHQSTTIHSGPFPCRCVDRLQTPLFQRGRCQVFCNRRDDPPAEIGSCCDAWVFSCKGLHLHETHDRIIFRADRPTRTVTPSPTLNCLR